MLFWGLFFGPFNFLASTWKYMFHTGNAKVGEFIDYRSNLSSERSQKVVDLLL